MSHFIVFKHRFAYIPRSLTIALLIKMSPCTGCATMAATSPLYDSYRAPDRDKNPLNPFYNLVQGLKDAYKKGTNAVQQFAMDSRYNLKPVFNPTYAANYNSPNSAGDFYRQASLIKESPWTLHQP